MMIIMITRLLLLLVSVVQSFYTPIVVSSRSKTKCFPAFSAKLAATGSPASTATNIRNDLLNSVLSKPHDVEKIQDLTELLLDAGRSNPGGRWTYDPNESLFGPLFCTVSMFTPGVPNQDPPLWQKISLKDDNIKGQQYYSTVSASKSALSGTAINYSEIWGTTAYMTAVGQFEEKVTNTENDVTITLGSPQNIWQAVFGAGTNKKKQKTLTTSKTKRTCPDDYSVAVDGAAIHFLQGLFTLNIPVKGKSTLRVLYADPEMRIFVSPQRNASPVGGEWENAGLIVIQVRSDLVISSGSAIDLRDILNKR